MAKVIDLTKIAQNADELMDNTFPRIGADLLERSGLSGRVFFDEASKLFYFQNEADEWVGRDKTSFATYMKHHGYCPVVRHKESEKISELEHVLGHISFNCAVQYAGAIAGFKKGLIENNGQRVLVTREARILPPSAGEWPILEELFTAIFGHGSPDTANPGPDQLPYLYGTWKHALECLNEKFLDKRILCLALAGSAGSGKSLVKDLISTSLGGRECKPYDFMIGNENFNGDFIGSELWVMDDEQGGDTAMKARLTFGANLKKAVADRFYRIRGMMRDGVVLEMFRFPLICLNREPDRLKVLPPLDDDIADKISVLLAHKHPMPMPVGTPAEKAAFWSTLMEELPHFVHYLLNEHTIPSEDYGRFGMKHFHHPDLCSDLFQVSREREFWVQVTRVLKSEVFSTDDICGPTWYWCGGASDLHELMSSESSPLTRNEINNLPWSSTLGRSLKKVGKEFPDRIIQKKIQGSQRWFITAEKRDVLDAVEIERGKHRGQAGQA